MNPTRIEGANCTLAPPKDFELPCLPLQVRMCEYFGECAMLSTWEPSPEELAELNRGGRVLLVVFGERHPAVGLQVQRAEASTDPFEESGGTSAPPVQ